MDNITFLGQKNLLSHDVEFGSDIAQITDLVTTYVMTYVKTSHIYGKILVFHAKNTISLCM